MGGRGFAGGCCMTGIDRRRFLAGFAGAGALALAGCAPRRGAARADIFPTAARPMPLPAAPVLDPELRLARIGIGSCFHQNRHGAARHRDPFASRPLPDDGRQRLWRHQARTSTSWSAPMPEALARPDYAAFRAAMPIARPGTITITG